MGHESQNPSQTLSIHKTGYYQDWDSKDHDEKTEIENMMDREHKKLVMERNFKAAAIKRAMNKHHRALRSNWGATPKIVESVKEGRLIGDYIRVEQIGEDSKIMKNGFLWNLILIIVNLKFVKFKFYF